MAFKKMEKAQYPPRLWALVGYPGSGKSSFATQMKTPLLAVDADHRFDEVLDLAAGDVYELSDAPADHVDADRIAALLAANMPGSGVRTIVVDSLTAIITPLVVQAMVDKDAGREKNLAAAFRGKALAMRQLQDAVTRWGCDTLWIYHLNDARDGQGKALVKATVSQTELARLTRSINLQLEIVQERGGRRGVKVAWARRGRSGMTIWDESGTWAGMPERIEDAVYGGLSLADQERIEGETPATFPNAETAIAWGMEQGAFQVLQHARNAYNKLKREKEPQDAQEMAALWIAEVQARLAVGDDGGDGNGGAAPGVLDGTPAQPAGAPQSEAAPPAPVTEEAEPPAGDDDEFERYFPRNNQQQANGNGNGNGGDIPTSPAALLQVLQDEFGGYFKDVRGLFRALQAELGETWNWPMARDVEGWRKAKVVAVKFIRKNS